MLGSIPLRLEKVIDTSIGLVKVEMMELLVLSIAVRWKTSLVTAVLPLGVLASWKKVVGSILLAWKTMSVLVLETLGGIEIAREVLETVLVAVLEAAIEAEEITGEELVQPAVLKEVEVDIVVTRSALVDLTLYEYVLQERRLDRVTVWLVTRGEVSLSTVLVPNEVVSPYSTWLEAAAEEVQVMVAVLVLAVLETEVRRRGAELKTKILLPDLFDT